MSAAVRTAFGLALALCATVRAQTLPPDVASLVDAERAFARASVEEGMRAAFLAYLADDAVVFRPEPVEGKKWYRRRPASPAVLVWEPAFADVSSSNDIGYTTGPWAYRPDSSSEASTFGHYVSVWKRGADREWEVAIDVGVTHGHVPRPRSVAMPAGARPTDAVTQEEARASIVQEEHDFAQAAATRFEDAFDTFASDDVRVYRNGDLPAVGREMARALLVKQGGTRAMQTTAAVVARDGDLGYTYGRCDLTDGGKVATSYYLRIWKRMPDGAWKIVLDLDSPVPAEN